MGPGAGDKDELGPCSTSGTPSGPGTDSSSHCPTAVSCPGWDTVMGVAVCCLPQPSSVPFTALPGSPTVGSSGRATAEHRGAMTELGAWGPLPTPVPRSAGVMTPLRPSRMLTVTSMPGVPRT